PGRAATPPSIATPPPALPVRRTRAAGDPQDPDDLGGVRDIKQPVSFSINLGYQVEGTQLTGQPNLGGVTPDNSSFARLRSYGFGEGFLSTRGVGLASLSSYFALRFQIAEDLGNVAPNEARSKPPPIATWFERSGSEFRTGWAEMKDFLPERFGLAPLRVRAGSQFVYGPWILHMDGALAAWETKLLKLQGYFGFRHSDYTRDQADDRATFSGASARIDLRGLRTSIPIAVAGEALVVSPSGVSGQPGATSAQVEVDWRPARDFALIGKARTLDGRAASEHLEFRGRYKLVSNLVVQIMNRRATDWRWDPSLTAPSTGPNAEVLEARRHLDLGPVLPRVIASVRGGTLIAENVDLFARGALAFDRTDAERPTTSYNAGYVEAGGALQVRLRRTVALDASVLTRQTNLRAPTKIDDVSVPLPSTMEYPAGDPTQCFVIGACQNLPDSATHGETGFTEVGGALRMSLGARRFSAVVEIYGRKTKYAQLYNDADPDSSSDVRTGGRFTVDAWVGQRVRIFAAYDVSGRFEFSPEITGYKSLRLIMSGTY
ncbi:MAG: hypothetical protein H0T79_14420, partial [Deltaproteobacteria bacterium]|nr:hypothetical protein [Deltaproteobacteria bacterium]